MSRGFCEKGLASPRWTVQKHSAACIDLIMFVKIAMFKRINYSLLYLFLDLLATTDHADYWAMKWSDILRIKAEFPVKVVRFSGSALRYGIEKIQLEAVPARITNPARTVVS